LTLSGWALISSAMRGKQQILQSFIIYRSIGTTYLRFDHRTKLNLSTPEE